MNGPMSQLQVIASQAVSASQSAAGAGQSAASLSCRFCSAPLSKSFVDLGMSPLCQTHITAEQLNSIENFYPLHAYVCEQCFLVQLGEYVAPDEIFTDYHYFSSYSDSWLRHCQTYCQHMAADFGITKGKKVIELASNDGYLLQYFVQQGVSVLGIEPADNVAQVARAKGVPTDSVFLGEATARDTVARWGQADLVLGNNVLAHVPDLNDFVKGMSVLLGDDGLLTMEFPHLLELMQHNQFDTIYHEHFSYFSFTTVEKVYAAHGLRLFDVQTLPTHGGSIRIYGCHASSNKYPMNSRVAAMKQREAQFGINQLSTYSSFAQQVIQTKRNLLDVLINLKRQGKSIVGYGAPGKGNTLLNYCGIRSDFLDFTVDRNPYKQGKYTPGTHIPIYAPERIKEVKPDYLFLLPWNLRNEIIEQHSYIRTWGGKFIVPIPKVELLP